MSFDFKFSSLLKYRKRLEDAAQREYLEARRDLDECLLQIQQYYSSIDNSRKEIAKAQASKDAQGLSMILQTETFIEGMKVRILSERARARGLMAKVEDKQELLIDATREFKKIEKLKDRMFSEYKHERKKLEAKRVDDLVVIRSQRRARL